MRELRFLCCRDQQKVVQLLESTWIDAICELTLVIRRSKIAERVTNFYLIRRGKLTTFIWTFRPCFAFSLQLDKTVCILHFVSALFIYAFPL